MTTKAEKYSRFDAADFLDGIDDAAAYLQIALEESADDPTAVPRALGVIARGGGTGTPTVSNRAESGRHHPPETVHQ